MKSLIAIFGGKRTNRWTWSGMALCRIGQPPRFFASSLRISSIFGRHDHSINGSRRAVPHAK
jgi:hypothetical protein